MAVRVATVALPMWGSSTAPGASSSRGWTAGSSSKTSRPAPKMVAVVQGVGQRGLVDDRARATCSPARRWASSAASRRRVDQVAGRGGERHVERHDVGAPRAARRGRPRTRARRSGGGRCAAPPCRRPRPGGPTARPMRPQPDDAHGRAGHVVAEEAVDRPARASRRRAGARSASVVRPPGHEGQGEGQVGRALVEHPGRVADGDAELGGGGDVDVVVADGHVGHHPEARRRPRPGRRGRRGR